MNNRLIISLLLLTIILHACKKSDPGGGMPNTSPYLRLVESKGINEEGEVSWKDSVFYTGEKVSELREYINDPLDGFIEYHRDEIEYPDQNTIVKTEYEVNSNTLELDPRSKSTFILDNELIAEQLYHEFYNNQWYDVSMAVYTYDDGLLQEITSWWHDINTWVEIVKIVFSYNGEDLEMVINYLNHGGIWVETSKYEYLYQAGRINQSILSRYDEGSMEWTPYFRFDIDYEAHLVSSTQIYEYDTVLSQWEYIGERSYDYDNQGILLSERRFSADNGHISFTDHTYEPGHGNYEQIYQQDATLFNPWMPFPTDNRQLPIPTPRHSYETLIPSWPRHRSVR
jgi:hypothetical protein